MVSIDQAAEDVLVLQPRMPFEQRLRRVAAGELAGDVLDGQAPAAAA
jgi:hypothetical protein